MKLTHKETMELHPLVIATSRLEIIRENGNSGLRGVTQPEHLYKTNAAIDHWLDPDYPFILCYNDDLFNDKWSAFEKLKSLITCT